MRQALGLALALLLGLVPEAVAQVATGNIYGTVVDASGAVVPGASLTLSGPAGSHSTTASSLGTFRFLHLELGWYTLSASHPGMTTVIREVRVTTGESVTLTFELKVASLEETLTVTAETPLVDPRKTGTGITVTRDELQRVPQARDPWAVLRTIPGVVVYDVNVAGNWSGYQQPALAKGADRADTTWNLDGLQVDFMDGGGTPSYWDYDAFEEMAVTTGGNDVKIQSGGLGLNLVTKRGTNRWRGSARGFVTHDDLQWGNVAGTELEGDPRLELPDGSFSDKARHIDAIYDYGLEVGGPIIEDKLFVWGAFGRQDIRNVRINQTEDKALIEGWNAKLNWQISDRTSASVFWFNGKKTVEGRDGLEGFLESEESALWDQQNRYDEDFWSPHGLLKLELNHVFGPNLFVSAQYANYNSGFGLMARGTGSATWDFANGVARGPWEEWEQISTLKNVVSVNGSYFAAGWGGEHELKFGFGYKKAEFSTMDIYGGRDAGLLGMDYGSVKYVQVWRQVRIGYAGEFWNANLGDTFSKDRLTVTAGLRFDHQKAKNSPAAVPAQASFPELLPALDYPGGGTGVEWNDLSPRVGVTYSLDEARKTVVRASYARYAGKLDLGAVTWDHPVSWSYLAYLWDDLDGNGLPSANEVRLSDGVQYYSGVDPANPASLETPNRIDPDFEAPKDHEVVVGIDRQIIPDLVVGAAYTWRRSTGLRGWRPRIGLGTADYTAGDPVTANGYTATAYAPDPELVALYGGGRILMNRPDYHRGYDGIELTATKRLSNRWMMRAAFSWMDWKEYLDGPGAVQNPTRTVRSPQVDGGQASFWAPKWQLVANGLYQLPYGFEVSGALFARQGLSRPIFLSLFAGDDGRLEALAVPTVDTERQPDVWTFDLGLAKRIGLGGERSLLLSADLFNVLNSNTVLERYSRANSDAFGRVDEILNPRVLRFGVRLTF